MADIVLLLLKREVELWKLQCETGRKCTVNHGKRRGLHARVLTTMCF